MFGNNFSRVNKRGGCVLRQFAHQNGWLLQHHVPWVKTKAAEEIWGPSQKLGQAWLGSLRIRIVLLQKCGCALSMVDFWSFVLSHLIFHQYISIAGQISCQKEQGTQHGKAAKLDEILGFVIRELIHVETWKQIITEGWVLSDDSSVPQFLFH